MNPAHPLWATLHWVVVIAIVGIVLRLNATSFDETELQSIAQIAIALAGLIGAKTWFLRRQNGKGD